MVFNNYKNEKVPKNMFDVHAPVSCHLTGDMTGERPRNFETLTAPSSRLVLPPPVYLRRVNIREMMRKEMIVSFLEPERRLQLHVQSVCRWLVSTPKCTSTASDVSVGNTTAEATEHELTLNSNLM